MICQKLQHTPFTITTDGSSDFNKLKLPIACPPRQSAVRVTKSGRKLKNLVFGRVESDIKFLGLAGMPWALARADSVYYMVVKNFTFYKD